MNWTLSYEIIDIIEQEDAIEIKTSPKDFSTVKHVLLDNKCRIYSAQITWIAQNPITTLDEDTKNRLETFTNLCDEDADIQWVVTNYQPQE
jgi:transcriptional/translational regulatory protein YebC/TACO1